MRKFITWMQDDKGASLAEWMLLVVLVAIIALIAVTLVGGEVSGMYSDIASATEQ